MLEIRLGRPEDYTQLMDQVAQSFREKNPGHPRFEPLYPDVIGNDEERMSHWRLAFIDGKMAGGIEIIPQELNLDGVKVSVGGIGNVHCWQPYRKSGCMSALLERCVADMTSAGTMISLLSGDRIRYGHYGWEIAGAQRRLYLTAGMRRHETLHPAAHCCDFRDYRGDEADAAKMLAVYNEKKAHSTRSSVEEFRHVLGRPNIVTYINEDESTGYAYVTVRGNDIHEYAGSTAGVERIVRYILGAAGSSVSLPPVELSGETERMFMQYAGGFTVERAGVVRINNLCSLLNAFKAKLSQRLEGWTGRKVLGIDDGEQVVIESDGTAVSITSSSNEACDVLLTRRDWCLLTFGPFMPDALSEQSSNWLRRIFPLPLFWGVLDHI